MADSDIIKPRRLWRCMTCKKAVNNEELIIHFEHNQFQEIGAEEAVAEFRKSLLKKIDALPSEGIDLDTFLVRKDMVESIIKGEVSK